jgi:hypothetical protein
MIRESFTSLVYSCIRIMPITYMYCHSETVQKQKDSDPVFLASTPGEVTEKEREQHLYFFFQSIDE